MPLEIPLLPPALLALLFLVALILNLRPPEGYRVRLGMLFRYKQKSVSVPCFYDAFGVQPREKAGPARLKLTIPRQSGGWIRKPGRKS